MVFRGGRVGRPGLLGTVARTAVVAGTAKATSNAMDRRSMRKADEQQAAANQAYQQGAYEQQQAYQQAPPPPPPPPAAAEDDTIAKLKQLAELHQSGVLDDAEFAAAKAKLLG